MTVMVMSVMIVDAVFCYNDDGDDDGYHDDQTGQKKQKSTSCADHPSSRAQESHSWPTDLWNWMENINLISKMENAPIINATSTKAYHVKQSKYDVVPQNTFQINYLRAE